MAFAENTRGNGLKKHNWIVGTVEGPEVVTLKSHQPALLCFSVVVPSCLVSGMEDVGC